MSPIPTRNTSTHSLCLRVPLRSQSLQETYNCIKKGILKSQHYFLCTTENDQGFNLVLGAYPRSLIPCIYPRSLIPCIYPWSLIPCIYPRSLIPCIYPRSLIPCIYTWSLIPCIYPRSLTTVHLIPCSLNRVHLPLVT